MLPTTPGDSSPYSTRSAFGLNPLFIHLAWLPEGVTLSDEERRTVDAAREAIAVDYDAVFEVKYAALERAYAAFEKQGASARSNSWPSSKLTNAPTSPTIRCTPGDNDVSSHPSARSRGQKPAPHGAQ